jgi:hypothetical protein
MKMIFDNENQKETMLDLLVEFNCPYDYDLQSSERCNCGVTGYDESKCRRCWIQSGLEMEVRRSKEE